jgi:hypothetical protein
MEPNNTDGSEVLETTEVAEETNETPEAEMTAEQLAELKAKAAKAEELEEKNKKLFERAKKAEAVAKQVPSTGEDTLSTRDLLALTRAGISDEDMDEAIDFAKYKKLSVAEALKHPTLKAILDEKASERKTAVVTQTSGRRGGPAKVSGDEILSKAERTGEVPDTDEAMAELFKARRARLFPKRN